MRARLRIGIDLGGTKIEGIVMDPGGGIIARRRVPTPQGDYEATLRAVCALVTDLEADAGALVTDLEADAGTLVTGLEADAGAPAAADSRIGTSTRIPVGIGTPGAISPATGCIKNANSVWLNGRPLQQDLERLLARPVRLANDANCFVLSEAIDGAAQRREVVFGVILGTGVGGGVVVRGSLMVGKNAIAGEWGHNPLPDPRDDELPGPECYCGRRGCIETFLSGPALARDFASHLGAEERALLLAAESAPGAGVMSGDVPAPALDAPRIVALATCDALGAPETLVAPAALEPLRPAAQRALERYVDRLARALGSVLNVLDPDLVVLGGGMSNVSLLYEAVPARWGRYVFSDRVDTRLVRPAHGDSSGVRGAARLW